MTTRFMGRRAFGLGMASSLIALQASAAVMINDRVLPNPDAPAKPRRDVPFTPLEKIPNHRQLMRDI